MGATRGTVLRATGIVVSLLVVTGFVVPPARAAAATVSTRWMLGRLVPAAEHHEGYARTRFPGWSDSDGDGCTARAEVLLRDALTAPSTAAGCRLVGGRWRSAYDGRLVRGSEGLVVDRLVPLREAWQSGAWRWSATARRVFANDLGSRMSLVVASSSSVRARGGQEPPDWLPANPRFRCRYAAHWVAVKYRWGLSADPAERASLGAVLSRCGWPRTSRPGTLPVPEVGSLSPSGVGATTLLGRCAVRTATSAQVTLRYATYGTRPLARSSAVNVPAGSTQVTIRLTGLTAATAYDLRCAAYTPTTGTVLQPVVQRLRTLAATVAASPGSSPATSSGAVTPSTAPTPTPAPTATAPTQTPAPSPTRTTSTTIVAVGDMCDVDPTGCTATGTVARSLHPARYALLGDMQYQSATAAELAAGYARSSWDAVNAQSYPAIGNHEIASGSDAGYCGFFVNAHCSGAARWYAYDIDSRWRAIVLDSNIPGNAAQLSWLTAELAQDTDRNLLVYWHHPRWQNGYSGGQSGSTDSAVDALMQPVYDAGADIVLWGHDHVYSRFAKMSPSGPAPAGKGMRAFIVGTGGTALRSLATTPQPGTEMELSLHGVLSLDLRATDYSWTFYDDAGGIRDSGTDTVTP